MPFTVANPTLEEFAQLHAEGDVHPEFSYQNYLALCQEHLERREEARQLGYLDQYEEGPDLDAPFSPEELELIANLFPNAKFRPQAQDLAA